MDINELLAKQSIRDAIYRYCRGEDRMDAKLSASLWHADGTASYGRDGALFNGPASAWSQAGLAGYTGSSHQVTNIIIQVEGDHAVSEAYVTARLWKMSNDALVWQRVTVGRYLDRWSCRDGVWAVDHRRFIFDFSSASTPVRERDPDWFEGRQGHEDPSYEVLGTLSDGGMKRRAPS